MEVYWMEKIRTVGSCIMLYMHIKTYQYPYKDIENVRKLTAGEITQIMAGKDEEN